MRQVQVHAITLNYNHDYFKQQAFLVRFIRISKRAEENEGAAEYGENENERQRTCVSRVFAATDWCAHMCIPYEVELLIYCEENGTALAVMRAGSLFGRKSHHATTKSAAAIFSVQIVGILSATTGL